MKEQELRKYIGRFFVGLCILFIISLFMNKIDNYFNALHGVLFAIVVLGVIIKLNDYLNNKIVSINFWDEHLKRVNKNDVELFYLNKLGKYDPTPNDLDLYVQMALNKLEEQGKDGCRKDDDYKISVDIGDYIMEIWAYCNFDHYKPYKLYHKSDRSKRYSEEDLPVFSFEQKKLVESVL